MGPQRQETQREPDRNRQVQKGIPAKGVATARQEATGGRPLQQEAQLAEHILKAGDQPQMAGGTLGQGSRALVQEAGGPVQLQLPDIQLWFSLPKVPRQCGKLAFPRRLEEAAKS